MGKIVNDLDAIESTVLVIIGDKLGLYKAIADSKPVTPTGLASLTGTTKCYKRFKNKQSKKVFLLYSSYDYMTLLYQIAYVL